MTTISAAGTWNWSLQLCDKLLQHTLVRGARRTLDTPTRPDGISAPISFTAVELNSYISLFEWSCERKTEPDSRSELSLWRRRVLQCQALTFTQQWKTEADVMRRHQIKGRRGVYPEPSRSRVDEAEDTTSSPRYKQQKSRKRSRAPEL